LIGSKEEASLGKEIAESFDHTRVYDFVGRTNLQELMSLIAESELLIGADSAPIHMAALTGTAVFNISFKTVNFWETGPKSSGSRIFLVKQEDELLERDFVEELLNFFDEDPLSSEVRAVVRVTSPCLPYVVPPPMKTCLGWDLIQAIYMGTEFPYPEQSLFKEALMRLYEVNSLALEQIALLKQNPKNLNAAAGLEQTDQIFNAVEMLSPEAGVFVSWLRIEKLRVGPDEQSKVLSDFEHIYLSLDSMLRNYPLQSWYQIRNGVLHDKNILDEA